MRRALFLVRAAWWMLLTGVVESLIKVTSLLRRRVVWLAVLVAMIGGSAFVTRHLTASDSATPVVPTSAHSRAILQAFVAAYNRHDVAGVLALFPDHPSVMSRAPYLYGDFLYGDCDYANHTWHLLTTQAELAAWLPTPFAEHDTLSQATVILDGPLSAPPNDPRYGGIESLRRNDSMHAHMRLGAKVVLTADGTHIQAIALASEYLCTTHDKLPSGM